MWWRFRKLNGPATGRQGKPDPWLFAQADEGGEKRSVAKAFFFEYYGQHGVQVKRFDIQPVERVDRSRLRVAGTYAGREIFFEAVS
jgi:hypothetical protein